MGNAKMEQLKKMKADNTLDMESLDTVAGGDCYQMSDDTRFLNVLLRGRTGQPDRYGATKCWMCDDIADELKAAWKSVGIICEPNSDMSGNNVYKLAYTGGEISREQAWDYVQARVGKYLKKEDWDW